MNAVRKRERSVSIQQEWVRGTPVLGRGESEGWVGEKAERLRAAQAGDRAALDELLAPHERALRALCHGILSHAEDAEDAAQETFFRALRALPGFQPGRAAFRTWLFRIAVNVCLNWKRDQRPTEPWDEEQPGMPITAASPETIALSRLQVTEALSHLPPRHRAIFLFRVLEGWSIAEIARAMGWKPKRVENELYRARRALAEWQARVDDEGAEP
jgi:RNA polymerase sigma-70 factor, ECF subfamily